MYTHTCTLYKAYNCTSISGAITALGSGLCTWRINIVPKQHFSLISRKSAIINAWHSSNLACYSGAESCVRGPFTIRGWLSHQTSDLNIGGWLSHQWCLSHQTSDLNIGGWLSHQTSDFTIGGWLSLQSTPDSTPGSAPGRWTFWALKTVPYHVSLTVCLSRVAWLPTPLPCRLWVKSSGVIVEAAVF